MTLRALAIVCTISLYLNIMLAWRLARARILARSDRPPRSSGEGGR